MPGLFLETQVGNFVIKMSLNSAENQRVQPAVMKSCFQLKCPSMEEQVKKLWNIIHSLKKQNKTEILPFVTTRMELEGIMLSEKSQRKTNNVWSHLYMESKKQNKTKTNSNNTKKLKKKNQTNETQDE